MRVLAVVPANDRPNRRLPHKFTLRLAGRPVIAYTLDALAACQQITDVAVVTNDAEVVRLTSVRGRPFRIVESTPEIVATDNLYDILAFALDSLEPSNGRYDAVMLAMASVPIRPEGCFDRLVDGLKKPEVQTTVWMSPVPAQFHPFCYYRPSGNNRLVPTELGYRPINSQDFPPMLMFSPVGSILTREAFELLRIDRRQVRELDTHVLTCDHLDCVDVDTREDFLWAEFLLSRRMLSAAADRSTT